MKQNSQKHITGHINALIDLLPEDQRKKVLVDRKIKQTHEQFAACVDSYILQHVNSVYLIKEPIDSKQAKRNDTNVSRETPHRLTVYVDNSLVAAELNAQRELIVLKFRELFNVVIDEFQIKISRGSYLEHYPFKEDESENKKPAIHHLTQEEELEIESSTAVITDADLRESFQRALRATKEHPLEK